MPPGVDKKQFKSNSSLLSINNNYRDMPPGKQKLKSNSSLKSINNN